jgi:hypothetical protein
LNDWTLETIVLQREVELKRARSHVSVACEPAGRLAARRGGGCGRLHWRAAQLRDEIVCISNVEREVDCMRA